TNELLVLWIAERPEQGRERGQHSACGEVVTLGSAPSKGLVERGSRVPQPALLLRRFRPALEQRGAIGVPVGGKRESRGELLFRAVDVEREGALTGECEIADRALP